ncbi:YhcH/YjgK/YiaL family protein [uncultured Tyzzerella sp.]|uniref:YhcH/YjgK/YiaL family protein n=1 Tax=uncultured Tyzzerella sp. TaxID=2321398 RepID=UPI002942CDCD|nr:YhcH/YjgK/YiaL family protein [uncultured Tyzzerella sp.]
MIYSNIKNIGEYSFLPENIQKCFDYIKKNNLKDLEKGSYEICGKDLFVNIVEYETTTEDKRIWEAHKSYLDIHFILDGEEIINVNFINNMEQKEFVEEEDFLNINGDKKSSIVLQEEDFLILYPNDAHMPSVNVSSSKKVKKAIFKVKI